MLSEAARDAKEVAGLALDDAKEGFNFEGKVNAARAICDDVGFATRKVMSELDELLKKAYKSKILDIIRAHSGINFNRLARYTALALVIDRSIDRFIEKYHDFGSTDDDLRTFVSLNNHAAMIGDEVVAQLKEMEVSENLVDRAFTGAVDVFNDTESFSETGRRNR